MSHVDYVSFHVALEHDDPPARVQPAPRGSRRAPPRGQVHPGDQGRPRPGRQAHPQRGAQGHAARRVDAPPEREGRPPRQGPRTAHQGLSYNEIVAQLGVSKSSVSLWVRDLPCPERFRLRTQRATPGGAPQVQRGPDSPACRGDRGRRPPRSASSPTGSYSSRARSLTGARAEESSRTAHADQGDLHEQRPRADPVLPSVSGRRRGQRDDLIFRVHIHESADVEAAQRFWVEVTGASSTSSGRPTLKRHNPKTVRTNVGGHYHGCLRIDVRRSGELYRKIEGWASGIMAGVDEPYRHQASNPALCSRERIRTSV